MVILLKEWLPKVLQKLECFLSSHDIEAGAAWIKVLFEQLEQSNVGIVCLTRTTLTKPWILFEAGALAKKIEASRLCPLLIGLNPSDVEFPLAAFQLKTVSREDIRSLLTMINKSREGVSLTDAELTEVFDLRWPQFEKSLNAVLKEPEEGKAVTPSRSDSEILNEILSLTRGIASQTAPPSEPPTIKRLGEQHSVLAGSELAGRIWEHVVNQTAQRRRLILGWLEKAFSVEYLESAGVFEVYFKRNDRTALESLSIARTTAFVQGLVNEIQPNARLKWRSHTF